ncbi:MAG: histidine phosphatase family protein [Desulfobacteraceae bacterium]|nr:histidine phosphatase family protein [Desulfobacteraceae bacterium]
MKILSAYKPELNLRQKNPLKRYSQVSDLVFLLRHGQIINNGGKKRYIGTTDARLDDTGILQAHYWQEVFSAIKIDAIYASSLSRCRHTARIIANEKSVVTDSALNEINMGDWDGRSFDRIKACDPVAFEKRGTAMDTFKPFGGESFLDVSSRVLPCFDKYSKKTGKKLFITHAGVIRVLLCSILKKSLKDLFEIKMAYGQLFVLEV